MSPSQNRPPIPTAEQVDGGPLVELELRPGQQPLFIDHAFSALSLRIGDGGATVPIEVESGLEWPQLEVRFVAFQDAIMRENPRLGWAPIGGAHDDDLFVAPSGAPALSFGDELGEGDGVVIGACETYLSLCAYGKAEIKVRVGVADLLTVPEVAARGKESALLR
jgi:hypothetical protein